MTTNLETRSLLDELRSFDKGGFFDLGHPLLNRIAESFVKAAGIGAIKGVAREGCYLALEGTKSRSSSTDISAKNNKKNPFPYLRGETNRKSLEAMVKSTGKESLQWGEFLFLQVPIGICLLLFYKRPGCRLIFGYHIRLTRGSWRS
ncbi:outer envelope pore protein 16-2, chloroplastic isoform X2 [Gossypium arboreum]|uniref:outer envelope pore protein 16-2, chloroplastic isoform X2 n=1 Tax=Gossypium arboreum TaxID=29729 RepID=UPI000818FE7E|nr:outer envelope pore protein 16-2, chloroplastic isoform X2 [Gossypium arboreum]